MLFTDGKMYSYINVNCIFLLLISTVLFPKLHFMFLNKQEKDEQKRAAEAKKTDAVSPDDAHDDQDDVSQQAPVNAASRSQSEVQEEEEDVGEEEEAEASGGEVDAEEQKTEVN
jgi:hypothetical protein